MTPITRLHRTTTFAAILAATLAPPPYAEEIKITVWAGGSGGVDTYRIGTIAMAADIL